MEQSPHRFVKQRSFLLPQLVPAKVDQSPLCLEPSVPTQFLAPHASTPKTIKIILKKTPPASTICPDMLLPPALTSYGRGGAVTPMICPATLLPPTSTLVPAEVELSPPCPARPARTKRPAPHALTLNKVKINLKTTPPASTILLDTLLPTASTSSG